MNARIIFSIIVVVFGATAAMLPQKKNSSIELNEKQLLQEMLLNDNYVSVDELADLLIAGDPSVRIIDVRPASDFKKPIARAINIPYDSIFSENYLAYFDQLGMQNVIYSGDDQLAVQTWMLMKQKGYLNNYLLQGGLEEWNSKILDPQLPKDTDPEEMFVQYNKRMAARQYFTGGKALPKVQVEPVVPIQRRKKKKVQGGCS